MRVYIKSKEILTEKRKALDTEWEASSRRMKSLLSSQFPSSVLPLLPEMTINGQKDCGPAAQARDWGKCFTCQLRGSWLDFLLWSARRFCLPGERFITRSKTTDDHCTLDVSRINNVKVCAGVAFDYFGAGEGLMAAPVSSRTTGRAEEQYMLSCRSPKHSKSLQ